MYITHVSEYLKTESIIINTCIMRRTPIREISIVLIKTVSSAIIIIVFSIPTIFSSTLYVIIKTVKNTQT